MTAAKYTLITDIYTLDHNCKLSNVILISDLSTLSSLVSISVWDFYADVFISL